MYYTCHLSKNHVTMNITIYLPGLILRLTYYLSTTKKRFRYDPKIIFGLEKSIRPILLRYTYIQIYMYIYIYVTETEIFMKIFVLSHKTCDKNLSISFQYPFSVFGTTLFYRTIS